MRLVPSLTPPQRDALRREAIRRALETLPDLEQQVLRLRFGFEGDPESTPAIALRLGISQEAVRDHGARGLDRLTALHCLIADAGETE